MLTQGGMSVQHGPEYAFVPFPEEFELFCHVSVGSNAINELLNKPLGKFMFNLVLMICQYTKVNKTH